MFLRSYNTFRKTFIHPTRFFAMTKKILLAVTDKSEEIETVSTIDVLRRAGFDLVVTKVPAEESKEEHRRVVLNQGVMLVFIAI